MTEWKDVSGNFDKGKWDEAFARVTSQNSCFDAETFKEEIKQAIRGVDSAAEAFRIFNESIARALGHALVLRLFPQPYGWPLRDSRGRTRRLGRAGHRALKKQRTRAAWQAWKGTLK